VGSLTAWRSNRQPKRKARNIEEREVANLKKLFSKEHPFLGEPGEWLVLGHWKLDMVRQAKEEKE